MGSRRFRNWAKKLGASFVGCHDAASSTQYLPQPTGSEYGSIEPSSNTSEPHASLPQPAGDAQETLACTDAGADIACPPPAPRTLQSPAELPPGTDFPPQQTYSLSTSQRLWNDAYDRLKDDKDTADLVTAYVTTLIKVLGTKLETTFGTDVIVELNNPLKRQLVMKQLVEEGCSKFDKESKIAKRVGDFAQAVLSFKPLVDLAVSIPQAAPAALPWAGVCVGLQMLSNPAFAAKSNLAGITHVLSRMEWYDAVTKHILNEDGADIRVRSSQTVLRQLEEKVVLLYRALLLYQMKSVCFYYRHQGYVFLRNLVLPHDWDADLKSVTEAEETLRRDSDQYSRLEEKEALGTLAKSGKAIEELLGDIRQDIRGFIASQKTARSDGEGTECLQALFVVNPQDHMAKIEDEKDKLLYDVYEWMLHTENYAAFTNWDQPDLPQCRLLWIKGPAGTGKTMLMMGIIRELSDQSAALAPSLAYFFCHGTGTKKLNSATAALRSLLWMLLVQQPLLISHLQNDYKYSGAFADETEFYTLKRIFEGMLLDCRLSGVYLVVDALDEFDRTKPGLDELIQLISSSLVLSKKVKWLLSSRAEVDLLARVKDRNADTLDTSETLVELDTERLANPVNAYIEHKLSTLKYKRGYDGTILTEVSKAVHSRAKDNLLWIFLAFNDLKDVSGKYAVQKIMESPSGLPELYRHKMAKLDSSESEYLQHCRDILTTTSLAFRPLSLSELEKLFSWSSNTDPYTIVKKCSSFLTITEETVSLVHQSAKDYLTQCWLQTDRIAQGHADVGRRSIEAMSSVLKQNMYNLDYGLKPIDMRPPQPNPLAPIQYACIFWAHHLAVENGKSPKRQELLADDGAVLSFLKAYFLYWVESLTLLGNLSEGALSLTKLLHTPQVSGTSPRLAEFLDDADKFVRSHGAIIERAPMQIYGSALTFSPATSVVKTAQWKLRLPFIRKIAGIRTDWDAYRQTLEGHSDSVLAVAFSPDGKTLASGSDDKTVRLWDMAAGTHRQTLEGHSDSVLAVAFSPNGETLASASGDETIQLWDANLGAPRQTLEGHSSRVLAVAFSPDGKMLASSSRDGDVRLWDTATGTHRQTLKGHKDSVRAIAFSPDSKTLASASHDKSVRFWDVAAGTHRRTLKGHSWWVLTVAFSPDGETLATGTGDGPVWLWNTATGTHRQTLEGHSDSVLAINFSPDGRTLASASNDRTVRLWDTTSGTHQQTLKGHGSRVRGVAFSPDGKTLASASRDGTIRLWDTTAGTHQQALKGHSDWVRAVAFSPDSKTLASASRDGTVRLWDAATAMHRQILEGHSGWVLAVALSPDGKTLASGSCDKTVRLWNAATGVHRQTLEGHSSRVLAVTFSPDSKTLASSSRDKTIRLWDATAGTHQQTLKGHSDWVRAIAFSPDGKIVASSSRDGDVLLWGATAGTHWQTLKGHSDSVRAIAFSPDSKTLASASRDGTVRLWDVASGMHLQTLTGHNGRFLETDYESLRLSSTPTSLDQYPDDSHHLYVDEEWIAVDRKQCIWLPKDYRPVVVALHGNKIAMGHQSGRLTVLEVEFAQ